MKVHATDAAMALRPEVSGTATVAGIRCSNCELREMCLPNGLDAHSRDVFDQSIRRRRPLYRGETLYVTGRPAHSLYAIRCGSLKTYAVTPDGEEFVQGFFLPGDVLGLESLAGDRHDHVAVALEPTLYCEISAGTLEKLLPRLTPLRRQLMRIINSRLQDHRGQCFVHNRRDARVRLATFLLDLSQRRARRNLSPTRFRLGMDRRDIANYLGLSLETVSRGFSQLQKEGLFVARGKQISCLEPQLLADACGINRDAILAGVRHASH